MSSKFSQWSVKYRPTRLSEMVGQEDAVARVEANVVNKQLSHCILISGQTGGGKTTMARILAHELTGVPYGQAHSDIIECNMVTQGKMDDIRHLVQQAKASPRSKKTVFILDEVHTLSKASAQGLLKPMEEPPHKDVVWILCTDQPFKLLPTLRNRCLPVSLALPTTEGVSKLLSRVVKAEKAFKGVDKKALKKLFVEISRASGCVPRQSLQTLQVAAGLFEEGQSVKQVIKDVLEIAPEATTDAAAFDLLNSLYGFQQGAYDKKPQRAITDVVRAFGGVEAFAVLHKATFFATALLEDAAGNKEPAAFVAKKALKVKPDPDSMALVGKLLVDLSFKIASFAVDPRPVIIQTLAEYVVSEDDE